MSHKIGPEFMLKTQYNYLEQSDQEKGLPQPPLELPYDTAQPLIDLPDPASITADQVKLRDLIEQRVTVRQYAPTPLTLAELSYLLWCTQGIKPGGPPHVTRRTVPSAGSRHPFETLLLVNNVESLPVGLYRTIASQHKLLPLKIDSELVHTLVQASHNQAHIRNCAVLFIWVAVPARTVYRYGQRAYRYLHLDAGHVCQNLCLAAWALGGGVCPIAAFEDDDLNRALDLDGAEQFVIYMGTVGKRV